MSASASNNKKLNVILIGPTGLLGTTLVNGFQLPQYVDKTNLTLLVRKETAETPGPKKDTLDAFVAKGAKLVYGDITSSTEAELTAALKGQDVIVSAVSGAILDDQVRLIPAAKANGIKWFVPSEYGADLKPGLAEILPFAPPKIRVQNAIKAAGLDITLIRTSMFAESFIHTPYFGLDLPAGTITAPDSFETSTTSITPVSAIGLLTADAVVTGRGRNQIIKFGNGPYNFEQLAQLVEEATGKKLKRIVKPLKDSEAAVAANPDDLVSIFQIFYGRSKGVDVAWTEEETYQGKYKVACESFQDLLKKTFGTK